MSEYWLEFMFAFNGLGTLILLVRTRSTLRKAIYAFQFNTDILEKRIKDLERKLLYLED